MIQQLNPSIPLETPKGAGQAVMIIDYGPEHDLYWVVFLDDSGECWTYGNRDVRAQKNTTLGRNCVSSVRPSRPMAASAGPRLADAVPPVLAP